MTRGNTRHHLTGHPSPLSTALDRVVGANSTVRVVASGLRRAKARTELDWDAAAAEHRHPTNVPTAPPTAEQLWGWADALRRAIAGYQAAADVLERAATLAERGVDVRDRVR